VVPGRSSEVWAKQLYPTQRGSDRTLDIIKGANFTLIEAFHFARPFSPLFLYLPSLDWAMDQRFQSGDDLVFQLESGYGLLRVLSVDEIDGDTIWHLSAYQELFPDVEAAEAALNNPDTFHTVIRHMALTSRAFERTPAAKIGNRPVTDEDLAPYRIWLGDEHPLISDRSVLLMLGLR